MDQAAWTQDKTFIAAMIRYEIDLAVFGTGVARRKIGPQPAAKRGSPGVRRGAQEQRTR